MPEHLNFNTSRALNRDKQEKYKNIRNVCDKNESCGAFVIEWSHEEDYLFGIGCDKSGEVVKLRLNTEPGLFVACANVNLLKARVALNGYRIKDTGICMSANNFSVFDYMLDESVIEKSHLIKIYTKTFDNAVKLYYILSNDPNSYRYAAIPHYWDISKQIVLELFLKYGEPRFSTFLWIDKDLNIYDLPPMQLNRIIYDIETVSSDPVRVPTGEMDDDIFFSVSIIDLFEKMLYSAVYLPIDTRQIDFNLKEKMLEIDEYCSYNGLKNVIQVFTTEKDLLKFTMNILRGKGKLHFSDGFNSQGYDIKFLFLRCKYYNLHEYTKDFIWDMGFRFGVNQIPFDLYRASRLLFDVKNYSLNSISKHVLDNETKLEAVNSVELRFLFYAMKKYNRLYSHKETKELLNASWPSLRDAIHYNNLDTILVCNIIKKTECSKTIIEECNNGGISMYSLLGRFDQSKYKVLNKCFFIGLSKKKFLCRFKSPNTNILMPFYNQFNETDACNIHLSLENKLHTPFANKPNGYPGGFNFCYGEYKVDSIQIYDLFIAYMFLIVVANISDETAVLMPANIANVYRVLIKNPQNIKSYDYLTHTGINTTQSRILAYKYIYENLHCGGEFPFTHEELGSRGESLVILILQKSAHEGILSCIVDCLNTERENYKLTGKLYDQVLEDLKEKLCSYSIKFRITDDSEEEEDESENSDDEHEDNPNANDNILFKHDNLIIKKDNTFKFLKKNINKHNYKDIINELITTITLKMQKSNDMYRLRKTDVSSVYGCIGALNFSLAALITCLIRSTLIAIAQYVTHEIRKLNVNYKEPIVYYGDTDSIFIHNPGPINDFSSLINSKFPLVQIKLKTTVPCYMIQTKTAIYHSDGILKYGQNKNGPKLWRDMVDFFYNQTHIRNYEDIENSFIKFYEKVYKLKDLELFSQIIKIQPEYKKECPAQVLKTYIAEKYPTLSGLRKQKVFYYLQKDDYNKTVYRPFSELTHENIKDVNIFKFFNNNFKVISHLSTLYVHLNNLPFYVTITRKFIHVKMFETFVSTYNKHFKTDEYKINENLINNMIEGSDSSDEES